MTDMQWYVINEIIVFAIFFGLIFIFALIVWFTMKNRIDKDKLKKINKRNYTIYNIFYWSYSYNAFNYVL